jgi:hypothetical protein
MSTTVTFEAPSLPDPRKDLLLNGSIDKLPLVCESMEELIHEVRKYSDNDSYFMQIFPLFIDRVFGENVMDNSYESTWVRGEKGGWLKKGAESIRSTLTSHQTVDVSTRLRRTERTNAFLTQYGMSDFAARLLHLFVPEGSVSKMINDEQCHQHLLSCNFESLPKKVKMKLQGMSAYNCVHSETYHSMYDHWCQRSNIISSNSMSTQTQDSMALTTHSHSGSSSPNIIVNLTLRNYFFMAFIRYPTVELQVFPQKSRKGM